MIGVYQAEWCPYSQAVRQPPDRARRRLDRAARRGSAGGSERQATGHDVIPVLVAEDGSVVAGTQEILTYLDSVYDEPAEGRRHEAQARAHGL